MSHNIPHNKARLLFRRKDVYADGAMIAMRVWAVPRSARTPEGLKYSLAYIDPRGRRILGYDNSEGKGHHRHFQDAETPIVFEGMPKLLETFDREVRALRGRP